MVVSRRKYDPGKKMTKCKTSETPRTTPKKAKNPKDQPQAELKVDTEDNQPTMSTQDDPVDVDSDEELLDPFGEQQALFLKKVIKNVHVTIFVSHYLQCVTFNYIVTFTFMYVFVMFFHSFNYDQRRWFEILYVDLSQNHPNHDIKKL